MKKNRFRSLLLFCLCFATMLSFVGCFGSGSKTDTTAYQAKEDELKYNSLSDEGKFVLYKASLSDEELEKLKDKKATDLKGEEKEKFEKFKKENIYFLSIEEESYGTETDKKTHKIYVLRELITGTKLVNSGADNPNVTYTDMYTLGYKFVEDSASDAKVKTYTLEKLTDKDDLHAPTTDKEKEEEVLRYNSLSEKGKFVLFLAQQGKELSFEDLEKEENKELKAAFEQFKKDFCFLNLKKEKDAENNFTSTFVLQYPEEVEAYEGGEISKVTATDANGNDVEINRVYVEMSDRGYKFVEDSASDAQDKTYTLVAADKVAESRGFMYYIYMPIGKVLSFINNIVPSYIFTLFVFAILVKILLVWFGYKQQKTMIKQAQFKPKEQAIRNKYKGRNDRVTQQKMQQEIMEAQQAEGVSAFGGCLPLLIQFPIIIILYEVIRNPLQYVAGYSTTLINSIKNVLCYNSVSGWNLTSSITNYAQTASVNGITDLDMVAVLRDNWANFTNVSGMSERAASDLPNFYAFGNHVDLSVTPSITFSWPQVLYLLIPIITFVTLYFSMKLNRKMTGGLSDQQAAAGGASNTGAANKIMDLMMPALSTFFTFMFPAVLGIYWIFNNLLGTVQQFILNKIMPLPVFTEEDYKKAEKEYNKGKDGGKKKVSATVSDPSKPRAKTLHCDEDEEDYPELPPMREDDSVFLKPEEKKGKVGKASMKDEKKEKNNEDKSDNK